MCGEEVPHDRDLEKESVHAKSPARPMGLTSVKRLYSLWLVNSWESIGKKEWGHSVYVCRVW